MKVKNTDFCEYGMDVRAVVDCGPNQSQSDPGAIIESNEDNNISNYRSIQSIYFPYITSVNPITCWREVHNVGIIGTCFGRIQANRCVKIRQGNHEVKATIRHWDYEGISFKVPASARLGNNVVSIADNSSMKRYSNEVELKVVNKKVLAWNTIIDAWDLFKNNFKIHLNNKGSGASVNNTSYLRLLTSHQFAIPKVEIERGLFIYRFLVKDLDTKSTGGMELTKTGCKPYQLKLIVSFESSGPELIGYAKGKHGGWWDKNLAPDIQVNYAKIYITFNFGRTGSLQGAHLDFNVNVDFRGNVRASGQVWNKIMDRFMGDWDNKVKRSIRSGVRQALNTSENKNGILNELNQLIRFLSGISSSNIIANFEFKDNGIHITYY
jgi:hypothetical protein